MNCGTNGSLVPEGDPHAVFVSDSLPYNAGVSAMFVLVSIAAVAGNAAAIAFMLRSKDTLLTGLSGRLLVNLSIADLVTGCFCVPFRFQMILFQHWAYGTPFCYFSCFVDNWSLFCSVYTLLMIAVDRFMSVVMPFNTWTKKVPLAVYIGIIHLFASASALPNTLATLPVVQITDRCTGEVYRELCVVDPRFVQGCEMFAVVASYLLPLALMTCLYVKISRTLIHSAHSTHSTNTDRTQKVIRILVVVLVIFLICWFPLRLYQILKVVYPAVREWAYIPKLYLVAYWLGMSNCAVNPIIYSFYFVHIKRRRNEPGRTQQKAIDNKGAAQFSPVELRPVKAADA